MQGSYYGQSATGGNMIYIMKNPEEAIWVSIKRFNGSTDYIRKQDGLRLTKIMDEGKPYWAAYSDASFLGGFWT